MIHTKRANGGRNKGRRAVAILEFVFVSAMLLFLLFGIMEVGFMFSNSLTVSSAAQQGARAAALGGTAKEVRSAVYTAGGTLREPYFEYGSGLNAEYAPEGSADWQPWDPGKPPPNGTRDQVRITVTYEYRYITGDLLGGLGNLLSGKSGQAKDRRNLVGVSVMRYGG